MACSLIVVFTFFKNGPFFRELGLDVFVAVGVFKLINKPFKLVETVVFFLA